MQYTYFLLPFLPLFVSGQDVNANVNSLINQGQGAINSILAEASGDAGKAANAAGGVASSALAQASGMFAFPLLCLHHST